MKMNDSEYRAIADVLADCKIIAEKYGVSLSDAIALRQLAALKWAQTTWCNRETHEAPNTK